MDSPKKFTGRPENNPFDDTNVDRLGDVSITDIEIIDRIGTAGTRCESLLVDSSVSIDLKYYKRRWVGLIQLALMNAIISWTWLTFSPFSSISADFLRTDLTGVNWFSIIFLFAFGVATPPTIIILSRSGPKFAMVAGGVLIIIGSWIRYAAAQIDDGRFAVMLVGQGILGLAQPFALSAPVTYADMWFPPQSRMIATALATLANPAGAAIGQVVGPIWVSQDSELPWYILFLSCLASAIALPAFFIPARPPGRIQSTIQSTSMPMLRQLTTLLKSPEFWLMFFPFVLLIATFNSFSIVINQILEPHGFSDVESGITGAILIGAGLLSAAVTSPIVGKKGGQLLFIKVGIPLLACSYGSFIWAPTAGTIIAPYVCAGLIGAFSFSLLPVGLELIADVTCPVPASFSSAFFWMGGQVLGGVLLICVGFLRAGPSADPPNNLDKASIVHTTLAGAAVPFALALGLFGRQEAMSVRRANLY